MELLSEKLRIPLLHLRKTQLKDVFVAALSHQWCSFVKNNLKLPDQFENHAVYSQQEIQAFLWDSESLLGPDWMLVYIHVIPKGEGFVLSTSSIHSEMGPDVKDLTYSQYLHYVSQTNFKNLWKESQKKYPEAYRPFALNRARRTHPKSAHWQESLRTLLTRVYNCPAISLDNSSVLHHPTQSQSSCVLQALGIFECSSSFIVITEHIPHNVHQCLSLSPALLNSTSVKPLYVLFQMLHAVKEMQDRSLFVEGVSWQHFFINENLGLKVLPAAGTSLLPLEPVQQAKRDVSLQELTNAWVRGSLSNYDYLMALNEFAGRQIDNPFNHPVLPWISDLSSPFGNWRDMAKSKFRLNKGDRQLDLTFDPTTFEAPEGKEDVLSSQVPHHITDVLSEITYYVYQARRTARSVLCRYVRPNWNPLEYPSSIERMQQWTPDECIPQFFSDPSIFKSIHEDLPDLSYPSWASSPEDFIAKHRNALESPYVSERLHQWIDLTFGFRLSGSAAVKAKNVHLSLVDGHAHLSTRGVVQLFTQPHPRKLLPSPYVGRSPPRLPPAEEHFSLPLDFNPVGLLRQLETVRQFQGSTSVDPIESAAATVAGRRYRDLQWMVTLAIELFLPHRFRLLRHDARLEDRWCICQEIVRFDRHQLPRCLRAFVQTVFQNETITANGLPPPSAHQLLQPMVSLIPFPVEFPVVLDVTNRLKQLLDQTNADFPSVGKALSCLSSHTSVTIVVPYIKALLSKSNTAFRAALYLLDPVAAALGPSETAKEFLSVILKLMGPEQPTPPLVLLYHKRFLLMLQVRLGLRCFLNHISLLVVEGVGGCYNADSVTCVQQLLGPSGSTLSPTLDRLKLGKELERAESEIELETDVFTFEVGEEAVLMEQSSGDDAGAISGTPSRTSVKYSLANAAYPVRDIHELDGCTVSHVSVDSLLWLGHRLGPVLTARYLTRNLLRMLALCYADETSLNLADPTQESSPFQISGALLQGDFNANRILGCLASIASLYGEQFVILQYFPHAVEVVNRSSGSTTLSVMLEGGLIGSCSLVLASIPCLQDSNFMQCLREVVLRQLLEPMVTVVTSSEQIFTRGGVARSALAIKLLDCLCAVAIRLGADAASQFISEPALKLIKTFNRVSSVANQPSVSRTNSLKGRPDYMCHQRRLSNTLRQAQAAAEIEAATPTSTTALRPALTEAQSLAEMAATFTDHFAFQLLTALNMILGVGQVQLLLEQGGKAAQRCATQYAATKDSPNSVGSDVASKRRTSVFSGLRMNRSFSNEVEAAPGSSYGSRVSVVGNRIQLFADDDSVAENPSDQCDTRTPTLEEAQEMLCYRKSDQTRHLRGNWLAYWEHEAGRADRDVQFNFKQIRLLQLNGHTAGLRSIHVMDSETGILTAGRDKTARVWSLHSQGDGNHCLSASYIYQQHRKPLVGVSFIDSTRLAASCDGAVHLWDPFVGTSVRQLDTSSSNKFPTVTALKALPAQPILVTATAEGTLRMLDTRSPLAYQHELKISPVAAGLVRCLATGSNGYWVAAGHSSGILSLLDTRTGMLLSSWKGHEGEVLQVSGWASTNGSQHLISSSLDQSVSVWSADDGKLKFNLRGTSEPVHCLCVTGGSELVTATTANRIGVYTSLTSNASFSSTKLRSDTFKGVLTAMAVAPMNRMLLLGSDTGGVSLLC